MSAYAASARRLKPRIRGIRLLHHRSGEARELRQFACQESLAKIDIGEDAIERICREGIGRVREQFARARFPVLNRGEGEFILALEVVEEAAFSDAGFGAHVLDARCVVSLDPDNLDRRVDELSL